MNGKAWWKQCSGCGRYRKRFWESRCGCILVSVGAGLLAAVLCVSGFSALMTQVDAPDGLVSCMACVALCAGSFTAGYLAARHRRRHGILVGIGCGLVMYGVVFFIGLLLLSSFSSAGIFFRLILMLLCSAIGGVCGVNTHLRRPPR